MGEIVKRGKDNLNTVLRVKRKVCAEVVIPKFEKRKLHINTDNVSVSSWASMFGGMPTSEKLPALADWQLEALPRFLQEVRALKENSGEGINKAGQVIFDRQESDKRGRRKKKA